MEGQGAGNPPVLDSFDPQAGQLLLCEDERCADFGSRLNMV